MLNIEFWEYLQKFHGKADSYFGVLSRDIMAERDVYKIIRGNTLESYLDACGDDPENGVRAIIAEAWTCYEKYLIQGPSLQREGILQ
jgi:hypothetical protein